METKDKICIIGGGPAGLTTALFLAKKGISSTVIEKAKYPRDKICGDALSGKVLSVLKKLDPELVTELKASASTLGSCGVTFYAPNGKHLRVPFKTSNISIEDAPGLTQRRIDFDNFLAEKAKQTPLIKLAEETAVSSYEKTEYGFKISDSHKQPIWDGNLLIVSNGAQSSFTRQFAGITKEDKYYSAGIRQYFRNVEGLDHQNFIELHFLDTLLPGYFWIFPLSDNSANVGLGIRSDVVSRKKLNLRNILKEIIETHPAIKGRFKSAKAEEEPVGFGLPLGSKKRTLSGENFMLTGDAASLIDPFTGEGISNAMISGMFAADQAEKCITENNFSAEFISSYDSEVYRRLGKELQLSSSLQTMVQYKWLFNFIVNRAEKNQELRDTISCMFDDLDLRKKLKSPSFYFRLLK